MRKPKIKTKTKSIKKKEKEPELKIVEPVHELPEKKEIKAKVEIVQKKAPVVNKKGSEIKRISFLIRMAITSEKEYFVEFLSLLLGAGMDVIMALRSIKEEVKTKTFKRLIDQIIDQIESGMPIWKALDKSGLFADHVIALIRVGEESGRLTDNLRVVAEQQKKDRIFKSRVRSAMTYPVLVIFLAVFMALGISWFVLPRFAYFFQVAGAELPLLTRMLISVGQIFSKFGAFLVPGTIIALALIIFSLFFFKKTKFIGQWLLFHLPITKKFIQEIQISNVGYILGILLEAGLPILDAMDSLIRSTSFYNYRKMYGFMKDKIGDGNSFLKSFQLYKGSTRLIPSSIQQMIGSGEQSGRLAETLRSIGASYEIKTEITAKNLSTLIEPILLVFIGLGILGIALAIIVPLYGLLDTMNSTN